MYDVIIAGAGPVGLFLAAELRLAKLSVLVLEALADPGSPVKGPPFGMRGLWRPSVEALYRRGLLEQMAAEPRTKATAGQPRPGARADRGPAGHFAGIQFDYSNIDTSRWTYQLPSPADTQLGVTMTHLETVLAAHATAMGAEIVRGHGVDAFEASTEEVTVHAGETYRARWLVGCDGGRSSVRKLAGFEFVGTPPEFTGYSVIVELADPDALPLGRHHTAHGTYTQWQAGAVAIVDVDHGAYDRDQPVTREHVQTVLRKIAGTDVTVTALHVASTWTDHIVGARSRSATTIDDRAACIPRCNARARVASEKCTSRYIAPCRAIASPHGRGAGSWMLARWSPDRTMSAVQGM